MKNFPKLLLFLFLLSLLWIALQILLLMEANFLYPNLSKVQFLNHVLGATIIFSYTFFTVYEKRTTTTK